MHINTFHYHLPEKLIAKEPSSPRDACRLLTLDRKTQTLGHKRFFDLKNLLEPGDVLVFNQSKVIPARIFFKVGSRNVELFLVRKLSSSSWLALGKPGKVLKLNETFSLSSEVAFTVRNILEDGSRILEFSEDGETLDHKLEQLGSLPLPPYLKGSKATFEDYQTIFASEKGSVAAPTAGLHFTRRLLHSLLQKGVQFEFVTLHVGLGTFMPIKTSRLENHRIHSEWFSFQASTAKRLNQAKKEGRRIIAVGTTSVRVLESNFDKVKGFQGGMGETALFIYPGYEWKCVDGLITNFHLPKSTLLALTCSFGGMDLVMKAYRKAISKRYRFFSFGDAMFIF